MSDQYPCTLKGRIVTLQDIRSKLLDIKKVYIWVPIVPGKPYKFGFPLKAVTDLLQRVEDSGDKFIIAHQKGDVLHIG